MLWTVARDLLGKLLVVSPQTVNEFREPSSKSKAYRGPHDRAAHSYGGRRTKRTETMYGIGGTAICLFVYGMYNQFNVVTGSRGNSARSIDSRLEPVEGDRLDAQTSSRPTGPKSHQRPGKLCIALGIDRKLDAADLLAERVWLEAQDGIPRFRIATGPRIGIDYAEEWKDKPWRFWNQGQSFYQ